MRRRFLHRLTNTVERMLGVELPYMRAIVDHAPGAMLPIALTMPASAWGKELPPTTLHMVRLGATEALDCGECLQIGVNMARKDGLSPEEILAALAEQWQELSGEQETAFRFGRAVTVGADAGRYREAIRDAYGERGLIEASMAAAGAQLFPVLKRGMGFAEVCDLDRLDLGHSSVAA